MGRLKTKYLMSSYLGRQVEESYKWLQGGAENEDKMITAIYWVLTMYVSGSLHIFHNYLKQSSQKKPRSYLVLLF